MTDSELIWRSRAVDAEKKLTDMPERMEATFEWMLKNAEALTEDQKRTLRAVVKCD